MSSLNTTSVSLAITPTAVSTLFSHFRHKKHLKERPTVHLSYDEGLHLAQSFLEYASQHTVEELQGFTSQWVPSPHWIKIEGVTIPEQHLARAAELIRDELGEDGIKQVGGRRWWQWRGPGSPPLEGEWIEMRAHANERRRAGEPLRRVMLYVHGGAYYFGSVDEHRYQMQRHARKLRARVFAPRYRLSPQFPFPCGLQDCLAAYLYLVATQDPRTIVLAGDSAGGGMVLALLCILRDRGLPLPAGGILISPWVDLAHSFPSVAGDAPLDYIPNSGFHHKPSRAWPPPNAGDLAAMRAEAERKRGVELQHGPGHPDGGDALTVAVDGEIITLHDQIQMYTTNRLLSHPLVSPVMQPTLGGLPPLLIIVGGGEILRDEQIYVAHKCANPGKYAPAPAAMTDRGKRLLAQHRPTDVQLQVWDDLCHVATALSFTRPAKYMYRSVAQFGAWALARAQKRGIEIPNDSKISVITTSGSDAEDAPDAGGMAPPTEIGKAGDALPAFQDHMIRQRVTRAGRILPLPREEDLAGCCVAAHEVGVIKEGPVRKWIEVRRRYDGKYASARAKVHRRIVEETMAGFWDFGEGEVPPPSALAGRIPLDETERSKMKRARRRRKRNMGLALWSLWASKHDDLAVAREQRVAHDDATRQRSRSSRSRTVADEGQAEENEVEDEDEEEQEESLVAQLLAMRRQREAAHEDSDEPETGVAGKRPFLDGIALPFSIKNEAATASMATLHSDEEIFSSRPASPSDPSSPVHPLHDTDIEGYAHA